MTGSRDRGVGLGTGTTVPPPLLFPLQVLTPPGVIGVGDPKSRLDPSGPHKARGQLSPAGLFFWEVPGTAIPALWYPGQAQPSCGRAGGCRPPSAAPACARRRNGQGSSSSALSDFSNDRSRSLGQVAKAAEPPHAPRHAACKTSEQEGWKPYRIIQGKASSPAPAQPRRREGQERGAAVAPGGTGQSGGGFGKENGD